MGDIMNEKPVMYHNKILKEINNNRKVYNGLDKIDKSSLNKKDVIKKINDIVNSNNFIYTKKVHIVLDNEIITRKIVGIINNNLVTIDYEYIPLSNIDDIYI